MSNFIISLIAIFLIFIFVLINSVVICTICDKMLSLIDSGKIDEAVNLWNDKKYYLSFFVRDGEIDAIDLQTDYTPKLLYEMISEIKNGFYPNFENIF